MADEVKKSARGNHTWAAWKCDRERLLRLSDAMDKCFEAPRREVEAALDAGTPSTLTQGQTAASGAEAAPGGTGASAKSADAVTAGDLQVRMLARHSDLDTETIGPPKQVLADLDPVGLESISVTAGSGGSDYLVSPQGLVHFDLPRPRNNSKDYWFAGISLRRISGVVLQVSGSDPAWVRSTLNELQTELRKGVPGWWFLRHWASWFLYAVVGMIALCAGLYTVLGGRLVALALASAGGGLVAGSGMFWGARRLLPGFEITNEGQSGKGVAVLLFVAALVAQIPVGIFVNELTQ